MTTPDETATVGAARSYTEATHTAYTTVSGADPITIGARRFTPERITVNYDWRTQLGDTGWRPRCVVLSGRWLAANEDTEPSSGSGAVLLGLREAPQWARAFVEANLPTLVLTEGDNEHGKETDGHGELS